MVKRNLSRNSEPRNSLPDALCHSEQSHRNIYLDNDGALWQGMIIKCPGRIAAPSRGTWRNERGAMIIQDVIAEVYQRQARLIEKKEEALHAIGTIQTDDVGLKFSLHEAVNDLYAPLLKQCYIEIAILEKARDKMSVQPS